MKKETVPLRLCLALLLTCGGASLNAVRAQNPCEPAAPRTPAPLAAESFDLAADAEVGLEIEARSPGASWARAGSEAAAVMILIDGAYNQDLLLCAGARRAGVRALRPLVFGLAQAAGAAGEEERFALAHSPVLYARANTIDHFTDIPLLMYYEILHETAGEFTVRYTVIF